MERVRMYLTGFHKVTSSRLRALQEVPVHVPSVADTRRADSVQPPGEDGLGGYRTSIGQALSLGLAQGRQLSEGSLLSNPSCIAAISAS